MTIIFFCISICITSPSYAWENMRKVTCLVKIADTPEYPDDIYVSGPVNFDTYYVIAEYKAQAKGEISLDEGTEVEVVEKNDNGKAAAM